MKLFKTEYLPSKKKIFFNTQKYYKNIIKEIPKPKPEIIPHFFLKKKTYRFNVEKYIEKNCLNSGRWSLKEHLKFLEVLDKYGADWKIANSLIANRTGIQIRTHANKFFKKLKKFKDEDLGIDFTSDSIKNIKDMINHIKKVNSDYSVYNIFLINSQNNPTEKKKSNETEETQDKESKDDDIDNDIIELEKDNDVNKEKDKDVNIVNNRDNEKSNSQIKEVMVNPKENNDNINNNTIQNNNKTKSCFNPININNNIDKENQFYDYLNYSIFTNIIDIFNVLNSDILSIYLNNLRNCYILDIKHNNSITDNDS